MDEGKYTDFTKSFDAAHVMDFNHQNMKQRDAFSKHAAKSKTNPQDAATPLAGVHMEKTNMHCMLMQLEGISMDWWYQIAE